MGEAERVQVDNRMGNVAQCKDVRYFAQNCCLTCPMVPVMISTDSVSSTTLTNCSRFIVTHGHAHSE